jgi:hypothetical protein
MQEEIDRALAGFNWEYVEWAVQQLDWKWDFENEERVPTVTEMKNVITGLMQDFTPESVEMSCGGFVVTRNPDNSFCIHFVIL